MFRVLVAGPRHLADYALLARTLDALLVHRLPDVAVLHTGAKGAGYLACSYALARRLAVETVPTDWTDPRGVERRNGALVASADAVVLFDDGRDAGVLDIHARSVKLGRSCRVVRVPFPPSGRQGTSRRG